MKKSIMLILSGFIICTAFNKPKSLPLDYRDTYVGNYHCNRNCQVLNTHKDLSRSTDTITIGVVKDALDSILKITIKQTAYQVKLKNNNLYAYPPGQHWGGKFSADSIYFSVSPGLAGVCIYRGEKE